MLQVAPERLDALTAALYRILRGERPDPVALPADYPRDEFHQLVEYFNRLVREYDEFAEFMYAMARGELNHTPPPGKLRVLQSFKSLQANLRHLTWKAQQIAAGDLTQRVDFMGDFATAFNEMTRQLQQAFSDIQREKERSEQLLGNVTDSIRYAQRIQSALLPTAGAWAAAGLDGFSLWLPRDIVGGDIWCLEVCPAGTLLALLDCTGHGVPGSLMSMLAVTGLRRLIRDEHCHAPAQLLAGLNRALRTTLRQDSADGPSDDGLDAAICLIDATAGELLFAGARLPLYLLEDGTLSRLPGDRTSLGYRRSRPDFGFATRRIRLRPGQTCYLCSDGLLDQPGGARGLPFGAPGLEAMVGTLAAVPMSQQEALSRATLADWSGGRPARDDITLLGWRVSADADCRATC